MAPVAKELASMFEIGVLEPLQTADTIDGQVEELRAVLEQHSDSPITVIGHSWGAWISYILAARHQSIVRKLILVGSGPYEHKYVQEMNETRESRLSDQDKGRLRDLAGLFDELEPGSQRQKEMFAEMGRIMSRVDSYRPIDADDADGKVLDFQPELYRKLMPEAIALRKSGELLCIGQSIKCPVIAIHGDHDPHPYSGVEEPLSRQVRDFQFVLLENCGHSPWNERLAREGFYRILRQELTHGGREN